ncbi:MAG: sigma-70 family RNA polymerase sigma factor [Opitutaceae bacterium]|jgi:RNA polymerase sigma factor (sigma-70 family)|nr:sigma-70 family RNA polymerase sigma factor [Opitutaceae bacterium]
MPDDAALLCRYAETRAEDAFAELVRRHLAFVYSAALRRTGGDVHRAEDVTQIVFTDLARKARALSRHPTLAGWLHTSTRYAAASVTRSESRRQHREQEASAMADNDPATTPHTLHPAIADSASATDADWRQLRPVIDATLDRLDARDREIILLRFFGNHTFAAIGEKLRLTDDAVRKRADRALEKLRRHLARRGISSTAGALGLAFTAHATVATPASLAAGATNAALAATATVATTATTAATLVPLALMTHLKTGALGLALAAAVTTAGSATLAIVVSRQNHEVAMMDGQSHVLEQLRQQLSTTRTRCDVALRQLDEARARLAAAGGAVSARGLSDSARQLLEEAELRKHPDFAAAQHRRLRQTAQFFYGDLLARLGLDPADLEKLKELLVDNLRTSEDASHIARMAGDIDTRTAWNQRQRATEEKIREHFGDALLAEYREHFLIRHRSSVTTATIALDLADAGQPLQPEQTQILTRLIYEEIDRPAGTGQPTVYDPPEPTSDGLSAGEHAVLARAARQFGSEQLRVLRAYFVEERQRLKLVSDVLGIDPARFF